MQTLPRSFISNLKDHVGHEVKIRGWIFRIRELAKTTFILVKDCTGIVQCVGSTDILHASRLRWTPSFGQKI
jgi:nondiscriminating aspartyl-tRNA synthetase